MPTASRAPSPQCSRSQDLQGLTQFDHTKIDWGIEDAQTQMQRLFSDETNAINKLAEGKPLLAAERTALLSVNSALIDRATAIGTALKNEQAVLKTMEDEHAAAGFKTQEADITKQISVIEGKRVGGAQDLVTMYAKQTAALDAQLAKLDKAEKAQKRRDEAAQEAADLERAGVAPGGRQRA